MTEDQLNLEVYSEEFQTLFHEVLTRFVNEYDDMANMEVLQKASELLYLINK